MNVNFTGDGALCTEILSADIFSIDIFMADTLCSDIHRDDILYGSILEMIYSGVTTRTEVTYITLICSVET